MDRRISGQRSRSESIHSCATHPDTKPSLTPSAQNYLGHSINAPTGRWQKNKDVHWYNRDKEMAEEERKEEIRKLKEAEEDAISVALYVSPYLPCPVLNADN